jgi:hypothetical protein
MLLPFILAIASRTSGARPTIDSFSGIYQDGHCTALGIGKDAMNDHSTVTTHNADCEQCDIRITHVPSRNWPVGSRRPIFGERLAYPRLLEEESYNIHGPSYAYGGEDRSIHNWEPMKPIFFIDQVIFRTNFNHATYHV